MTLQHNCQTPLLVNVRFDFQMLLSIGLETISVVSLACGFCNKSYFWLECLFYQNKVYEIFFATSRLKIDGLKK